jgi:hypothetical protein
MQELQDSNEKVRSDIIKYLVIYPDGEEKAVTDITFELEMLNDDIGVFIYKFENDDFYVYLNEDDGWEKVEVIK